MEHCSVDLFKDIYNPRIITLDNANTPIIKHYPPPAGTFRMFHYTNIDHSESMRNRGYWIDIFTDTACIAGELTGLPDNNCAWRVEWSGPIDIIPEFLGYGATRWPGHNLPLAREYMNMRKIDVQSLTWSRMKDITTRCFELNRA